MMHGTTNIKLLIIQVPGVRKTVTVCSMLNHTSLGKNQRLWQNSHGTSSSDSWCTLL